MKFIITTFALLCIASNANAISETCSDLEYAYPNDIPWVEYQDKEFIFTRQRYNSICVDSRGREFEYGTIQGVYTPIDEAGGGCSALCVEGTIADPARGCSSRPPADRLVGFEYSCANATCKCLYQRGTLSSQYQRCFHDINTSNNGRVSGQVVSTIPQPGETCYSLHTQPSSSSRKPAGTSICTYTPDYGCYETGRPTCCSEDDGENCPDFLTMCDNHAKGVTGFDYCTNSPDFSCYDANDGRPSCCSEPGGSMMNCPKTRPSCDSSSQSQMKYLRSNK